MSATDERHRATAPLSASAMAADPPPAAGAVPAAVRASDTEREATVARLHEALGEGRLDLDETDVRVAAAYAASYRSDLQPLLGDLPHPRTNRSVAPTWAEVWASAVWRARVTLLGSAPAPPTTEQCRTAAVLAALVVLWMTACAFLGAVLSS